MEKIQQLLNEHKDKLWYPDLTISIYDWWFTIRRNIHHSLPWSIISLSEILFNTPFLSWLNWLYTPVDRDLICWDSNLYRDDWVYEQTSQRLTESDYHKINLALLSTDSERIAYLESNLL